MNDCWLAVYLIFLMICIVLIIDINVCTTRINAQIYKLVVIFKFDSPKDNIPYMMIVVRNEAANISAVLKGRFIVISTMRQIQ